MIDGPVLMILVGTTIQALPLAYRLLIHIRRRPCAASTLGAPART
ncbi:hypothetical protein [Sphingomonas sp. CFBP 13603]|nr:hypothetical protein [Sphingomonas sp. CFBP 13603]